MAGFIAVDRCYAVATEGSGTAGGIAVRTGLAGLLDGRRVDARSFDANAAADLLFVQAMVSAETRDV